MTDILTAKLQRETNVCTTADMWSAHHIGFFGVTFHWIEEDTMERKSASLACAQVKGRHTLSLLQKSVKYMMNTKYNAK